MAAYGATLWLLNALSFKLRESLDEFGGAVVLLYSFLEENREVKRDFEIQIREAVYEAQDIIRSINPLNNLSPSEAEVNSTAKDLDMVANRIISLAEMTTEEFHHQTLDRQIPSSVWKSYDEIKSMGQLIRPTAGRDEDLKQLKGQLMSGSEGLEVIPIVGIPGIGKTCVAHWLLDDPSTRDQFDATGLVRISVKYDKRKTLLDLLESMKERAEGACVEEFKKRRYKWSEVLHQKTNDQLVKHLQNTLRYKRFLILLDDIREVAIWHDLKELFPDNYNRSRILITARNFDVAPFCCHELDFINDKDFLLVLKCISPRIAEDFLMQFSLLQNYSGLPTQLKSIGRWCGIRLVHAGAALVT